MRCLKCGGELLDAVALTVRMGGVQLCGPCIDKGRQGGWEEKEEDCPKCGLSLNPRHVECECDDA